MIRQRQIQEIGGSGGFFVSAVGEYGLSLLARLKHHHVILGPHEVFSGLDLLLSWTFAFGLLCWLHGVSDRLPWRLARTGLKVVFCTTLFCFNVVAILCWYFFWFNGYFPSADVAHFVIANAARVYLHLLQTSVVLAVLFFLLSAIGTLFIFRVTKQPDQSRGGRRPELQLTAALLAFVSLLALNRLAAPFATLLPLPHLVKNYSIGHQHIYNTALAATFDSRRLSPPPAAATTKHNPVIILLIESMRRSLRWQQPSPIPFMRALAEEATFFDKSYATASHSDYADLAVWYSRYPLRTLNKTGYAKGQESRGASIFSVLKAQGYKTAYISSQNEKWGGMINWLDVGEVDFFYHSEDYEGRTWMNRDDVHGLQRLVRTGIATAGKLEDAVTLTVARKWIHALPHKDRFVLGLNLQNTHFNYVIPRDGAEPFQPSQIDFKTVYYNWPKDNVTQVRNRYFNAFYNLDLEIRQFVDFLKQQGIWQNCVFAIVGDSGEAFYEHGFGNHSGPMYDEVMRTFTVIKRPGASKPEVINQAISHIDIVPGILDLLDVPSSEDFQGVSPFQKGVRGPIYMHTNAVIGQHGLVRWPWKLLETIYPAKRTELYKLDDDRDERHNLASQELARVIALKAELKKWVERQLLYYSDPTYYRKFVPPQ